MLHFGLLSSLIFNKFFYCHNNVARHFCFNPEKYLNIKVNLIDNQAMMKTGIYIGTLTLLN